MTNGSGSTPDANAGGATDTSGEVSIDTDHTGNRTTDEKNSNDSTINRQTGNRNGQSSIINPTVDTSNKAFEGAEPDIRCVLGLRFETLDKKVEYYVFRNKFTNYIGRTVKYVNELLCAVK